MIPKLRLAVAGVCVFLFSCTAYFNTFYNAQIAFEEARELHSKVLEESYDSLVVTPPQEAIVKYDRTIEKGIKVIEVFPKKKKWHDDALFLIAQSLFYKKEMPQAVRRLRQLEQEFPASPFIPQAYLFLVKAYIEDGNLDKAEEILKQAQQRFPQLDDDQQLTLLSITIAIRRGGKSQAIGLLEQAYRSIKSQTVKLDLLIRTAELYIELKQYDKAIPLLKTGVRRKEFPFQSFRVDRALLDCYEAIDSLQTAYKLIQVMVEWKYYAPYMDEMIYRKGMILYAMGNCEEAIKVFRKMTSGIDTASITSDTSGFTAKALLQLALIYQKTKEDYKKAQSYYKLASMARDTGVKKAAARKLSAIEKLDTLRAAQHKNDSLRSKRIYAIGELFRFELEEPDSAFEQFMLISRDSASDTALVPKAISFAAHIARDELHDTARGDSLFRLLVTLYPASEYAKIGQRELNLPVTVMTRQDSALTAYHEAERFFYIENDVKGAIQAFFRISNVYPELDIAAKSLFAAAYFSDNILLKKKTAKTLYERVCSKFPETIYCTEQAKPRMKIVVDTLANLDRLRKENAKNPMVKKKQQTPRGNKDEPLPEKKLPGAAGSEDIGEEEGDEPLTAEELNDGKSSVPDAEPAAGDTVVPPSSR